MNVIFKIDIIWSKRAYFNYRGHPCFGILSPNILLHDNEHIGLKYWKNRYGNFRGNSVDSIIGIGQ